jgi:putative Holliday junction resolvase
MSIDYGTKRTGVALSDPTGVIAGSAETIPTASVRQTVAKYIAEKNVTVIVLGLPTRMDGSPSDTLPAVRRLGAELARLHPEVEVDYYDERFTSVLAKRAMIDGGVSKTGRRDKGLADRISAAIILQDYIDNKK